MFEEFQVPIDLKVYPLRTIEADLKALINRTYTVKNGVWRPNMTCKPSFKIAFLVTYRNRAENLRQFLNNMHRFLTNQSLHYGIYVIESAPHLRWNKGALYNIGYLEAIKDNDEWDCFFLHDIDMLPEDVRNYYTCEHDAPVHYASTKSKANYRHVTLNVCINFQHALKSILSLLVT